jgi:hypothetical protein
MSFVKVAFYKHFAPNGAKNQGLGAGKPALRLDQCRTFWFASCDLVDRSLFGYGGIRSTKSHELTNSRTKRCAHFTPDVARTCVTVLNPSEPVASDESSRGPLTVRERFGFSHSTAKGSRQRFHTPDEPHAVSSDLHRKDRR